MEYSRRRTLSGRRYLHLTLDGENYCLDILSVRELLGMAAITPLPNTPPFVRGVINLRGQIIPIVDLRLKFGMEFKPYHKRSAIVVVELSLPGETLLLGLVVDAIQDVVAIPDEKVNAVPYLNAKVKAEYIRGIADTPEGMMIILDAVKVLSDEEYVRIKGVRNEA